MRLKQNVLPFPLSKIEIGFLVEVFQRDGSKIRGNLLRKFWQQKHRIYGIGITLLNPCS
jgi:hypothetical protein